MEKIFQRKSQFLLEFDEVPVTHQEYAIETGYRKVGCSLKDCVLSAFFSSNETLNFWTHFLPFWYFVYLLVEFVSNNEFASDRYHWPFLAFMVTVCTWPALSCLAHLFSTMSPTSRHICFFIDYIGLSWYSFGSSTVYHAYCFPSVILSGWFSSWFMRVSAVSSILCTILACSSRFIHQMTLRKMARIFAFGIPYTVVNGPLLYRMSQWAITGSDECSSMYSHFMQFFCTSLGMAIYWSHYPEKLAPRRFDFIGHSHQLFHICGILASSYQMRAVFMDMDSRRDSVELVGHVYRAANDVSWTGVVLLTDCIVAAVFVCILISSKRPMAVSSAEVLQALDKEIEKED